MAATQNLKISQIAKDMNLKTKDVTDTLTAAGIEVKSTSASVTEAEFSKLINALTMAHQISDLGRYMNGETVIIDPELAAREKAKKAAEKEAAKAAKAKAEEAKKAETKVEKPAPKAEPKPEPKPAKAEAKPEVKPANPEPKPEPKPEAKPEPKKEPELGYKKPEYARPKPIGMMPARQPLPVKQPAQPAQQPKPAAKPAPAVPPRAPQPAQRPQNDRPQQNGQRPQGDRFDRSARPDTRGPKPQQNRGNQNGRPSFDKDDAPQREFRPRPPKPVFPEGPKEIKTRTGNTRVVDTRTSDVDLSKYDERLDNFAGGKDVERGGTQRLKKQNNRDSYGNKKNKEKERAEMEKLKRAVFEKAKNQQLSITVPDEITVGELASRLKVNAGEVVKKLMLMGVMATVNQIVDYDTAYLVADELGAKVTKEVVVTIEEKLFDEAEDTEENLAPRSPVVCVMGHVDHGKTSLLDAVRHTNVTAGEAGGITQAIGAYRVTVNGREITFLDTPGHEAFTAMRLRGAMATDIAIIVVAADDGIMPQTVEAINHAKAAGVDIIIAINKMDRPGANPDAIKQELTKYDLVPEEWGGDVICVPISALTGMGIPDLLENVLLVADMKDLKANANRRAKGIIIESRLDKGRGPVATVLVQNGTLHAGDTVIAGTAVGRVRAMVNDKGRTVKEAGPSVPVEIVGLSEVPAAGDEFNAVENERMARELAEQRKERAKEEVFKSNAKVNLDDLFAQISEGVKELNIVVKADVDGSVEAVKQSLVKLSNDEVKVKIIHSAVGGIVEGDVTFAAASNAIIVGFNVRPDKNAMDLAEREGVDIRTYRVIYTCIEEIGAALKGMLAPQYKEVVNGHAEVRQTIHVPSVGTIAGSYVQDGKVTRNSQIRVLRDGIVIFEDKISSLRRFKEDVKEVAAGYECGIGLEKFNDIKEGDILESFEMQEVAR